MDYGGSLRSWYRNTYNKFWYDRANRLSALSKAPKSYSKAPAPMLCGTRKSNIDITNKSRRTHPGWLSQTTCSHRRWPNPRTPRPRQRRAICPLASRRFNLCGLNPTSKRAGERANLVGKFQEGGQQIFYLKCTERRCHCSPVALVNFALR